MKLNHFSMPSAQELQSLIEFCRVMASAPFYQKLGPGGVMAIYLTAKERDLPFMSCLNGGLHSVDGKITYSALMIDALIMKAGHKTKLIKLDEKGCTVRFTRGDRKGDPDYEPLDFTYTLEDARIAGYLTKNNWRQNPKPMLYSRCITGGARIHMSEVMLGVLVQGELVGSDSDGDLMPQLPEHVNMNELPAPNDSAPAQIEQLPQPKAEQLIKQAEPLEGFDVFVERHSLKLKEDGSPMSKRMEYVLATVNKTNMGLTQVINSAIKNEKIFDDRFEKWLNASEKISV